GDSSPLFREISLYRMNSVCEEPRGASSRLVPIEPAASTSCSMILLVFGPSGTLSTNAITLQKNGKDRSSIPSLSSRFMLRLCAGEVPEPQYEESRHLS